VVSRRPAGCPSALRIAVSNCGMRGPFGAWINATGILDACAAGFSGGTVRVMKRRAIAVLPLFDEPETYCPLSRT
jgi:hypothetical protein